MRKYWFAGMLVFMLLTMAVPTFATEEATGTSAPVLRDVWKFIGAAFVLGVAAAAGAFVSPCCSGSHLSSRWSSTHWSLPSSSSASSISGSCKPGPARTPRDGPWLFPAHGRLRSCPTGSVP